MPTIMPNATEQQIDDAAERIARAIDGDEMYDPRCASRRDSIEFLRAVIAACQIRIEGLECDIKNEEG